MSFSADLSRFILHNNGNIDKTVRQTVVLVAQGVVMNTAVRSGRARANWIFGKTAMSTGTTTATDTSGSATIAKIASQVTSVKAGGSVWLSNNLPYIYKLEYLGWSRQSPNGMVRKTLENLPAAIESYVRGLQ